MLEQYRGSSTVLRPETATAFFFMLPEKLANRPSDVLLISRKRDIRISWGCGNGRYSPSEEATLKFIGNAQASAIVVPYQAISSTSAGRPLHKPHHGGSLRRRRLCRQLSTQGDLVGEPCNHNVLRQRGFG